MKLWATVLCLVVAALMATGTVMANTSAASDIKSSATGEIISDIKARATGGLSAFDGNVDEKADLEDLVKTAWGNGSLGSHRGHSPILSVLEAFLGINHDEMHVFMEQAGLNLAGTCEALGFEPENLVESLTASFIPYVQEAVDNQVIAAEEAAEWEKRIREAFSRRVYWEGN